MSEPYGRTCPALWRGIFLHRILRCGRYLVRPGLSQELTDPQLRFVQLRLGISHRAIQYFRNLLVFVAFDFVQQENGAVAREADP